MSDIVLIFPASSGPCWGDLSRPPGKGGGSLAIQLVGWRPCTSWGQVQRWHRVMCKVTGQCVCHVRVRAGGALWAVLLRSEVAGLPVRPAPQRNRDPSAVKWPLCPWLLLSFSFLFSGQTGAGRFGKDSERPLV